MSMCQTARCGEKMDLTRKMTKNVFFFKWQRKTFFFFFLLLFLKIAQGKDILTTSSPKKEKDFHLAKWNEELLFGQNIKKRCIFFCWQNDTEKRYLIDKKANFLYNKFYLQNIQRKITKLFWLNKINENLLKVYSTYYKGGHTIVK